MEIPLSPPVWGNDFSDCMLDAFDNSCSTYEFNDDGWFLLASLSQATREKNNPQDAICQIPVHKRNYKSPMCLLKVFSPAAVGLKLDKKKIKKET